MAFGFFKKNETADAIFMGGKIYTQNPDFPWVEAVACKDGLVWALGDYEDISELEGKHTEIVNLEGGVMLPGYMDTCGHPAIRAFQDSCLFLAEGDLEAILAQVSEYAAQKEDADVIFAYGYEETIAKGLEPEQTRALLDKISADRPVIVLGKGGFHCLINTAAMEIVKAAAEEDEVTTVTLSYILGILDPISLDTLPEALPYLMGSYCQRGFTSVFDCGAPDFFASVYQNMMVHLYQEELLKHRVFGSLLITRDVNPKAVMYKLAQFRTNCAELNGRINFETLKLVVEGTGEERPISGEALKELCMEAGDRGFDVHIDAIGEDAVEEVVEALRATRSAGYKKNAFTLAHGPVSNSGELADACFQLDITEAPPTLDLSRNVWGAIENAASVEEAVSLLTSDAALQLGVSGSYGSIEKGKQADFAIFRENPLEAESLAEFKEHKAMMTVIGGAVVYNAEEDDISQWHQMMSPEQEMEIL